VAGGTGGGSSDDIRVRLENLTQSLQQGGALGGQRATAAMATLAEGIQSLVQHMRTEQQMAREQMTRNAEQQKQMLELLQRLDAFFARASKN